MTEAQGHGKRSDRTLHYTGGLEPTVPAGITSGPETAETAVGQAAVLSAVNMLARVHPAVTLAVPDVPLVVPCPTGGRSLVEAGTGLAAAANPDVTVEVTEELRPDSLGVGLGADSPLASVYAGGARWTARTGSAPEEVTGDPSSVLGVGMAVGLACAWIFRTAVGLPAIKARSTSLWTLAETGEVTGPSECGPVDVGSVWMVGAGAVGSSLAWWLQYVGVAGPWTIIDGDPVDVTNLNRSLGLFAADAGLDGQPATPKAGAVAALIPGASGEPRWWSEWVGSDPPSPDVVLPVANTFGVRPAVAAYGHPAVLHATTSPNWSAELHRHVIGADGCTACRLPEAAPRFDCATAPSGGGDDGESGHDAALPFLSGSAGLVLLAGLLQLQHGHWPSHTRNHWRWWFDDSSVALSGSRWGCLRSCTALPTLAVRHAIHGHTRWHGALDAPG